MDPTQTDIVPDPPSPTGKEFNPDDVWGPGNWMAHLCPHVDNKFTYHHRDFHGKTSEAEPDIVAEHLRLQKLHAEGRKCPGCDDSRVDEATEAPPAESGQHSDT